MSSSAPVSATVSFTDLPHDMLREIAARLPYKSVGALALSCKTARDALVARPGSMLWRTVTCRAAFLASTDPAAVVLRERATEVKTLGLRGASARVEPALRRFTSLKSLVLGVASVADGERLLNAAAAVSPQLTTATIAFPRPRQTDADEVTNFTVNAPQLKHFKLVWQAEVPGVRVALGQWNAPALETIECKGFVPDFATESSCSDSELRTLLLRYGRLGSVTDDPEVVAAMQGRYAEACAGVPFEGSNLQVAFENATKRSLAKRVRELVDAGKMGVRRTPRLGKIVLREVEQDVLTDKWLPLAAFEAVGVDVVHV